MSERIVFFGSGPVAAASLRLLAQDFQIEAVITKPKPLHHKGSVPVVETAEALRLPILTAANRLQLDALFQKQPVHSRLAVLVDFGIIVSQRIIDSFPLGIVNSHFSLLPKWRGADPISFAILNGDGETGVSLMLLVARMDEGPLLAQRSWPIAPGTTTPMLTEQLINVSHGLLRKTLPGYMAGALQPYPQSTHEPPTYSRKLTKEDGIIDWHKPAVAIEREIRAFAGWPKSHARFGPIDVVITAAKITSLDEKRKPGELVWSSGELIVACGRDALLISELKPSGKQMMTGRAFLAGYKKVLAL